MVIKRLIDYEVKNLNYISPQEKPGRVKGLRKEVKHGTLSGLDTETFSGLSTWPREKQILKIFDGTI